MRGNYPDAPACQRKLINAPTLIHALLWTDPLPDISCYAATFRAAVKTAVTSTLATVKQGVALLTGGGGGKGSDNHHLTDIFLHLGRWVNMTAETGLER